MVDFNKLKSSGGGVPTDKYQFGKDENGGGRAVHTMTIPHERGPNKVVFSFLPPEIGDGKSTQVLFKAPESVILKTRLVVIDKRVFILKPDYDDPINAFLWNRYNKVKSMGGDTKGLAMPNDRYLAMVYVHSNREEPDKNGTVQVVPLSRILHKNIMDAVEGMPEDATVFGLFGVAGFAVSYVMKNKEFGDYLMEVDDKTYDIVSSQEELDNLVEQINAVKGPWEEFFEHGFDNYDQTIQSFIDMVGVAEWNQYAPSAHKVGGAAPASAKPAAIPQTPPPASAAQAIDDSLPDSYSSKPASDAGEIDMGQLDEAISNLGI